MRKSLVALALVAASLFAVAATTDSAQARDTTWGCPSC